MGKNLQKASSWPPLTINAPATAQVRRAWRCQKTIPKPLGTALQRPHQLSVALPKLPKGFRF